MAQSRLYLHTFAGLSVFVEGTPAGGAGQQRKTLALLALLAAAGRRGVSRDKLVAYLWPEADDEHARGLLKQACYALRRDLEAPELFLGATELRLNTDVVTTDILSFESAVEGGDLSSAAALYAGPFLDGFNLNDAPEFERWVETERDRLHRRAGDVLETLASQNDGGKAALDLGHRLFSADAVNPRIALALMKGFAASGDRASALATARTHEQALRDNFDAAPDAEVVALVQRLRADSGSPRDADIGAVRDVDPAAGQPKTIAPGVAETERGSIWRVPPRLAVAGVVALAIVVGGWLTLGRGFSPSREVPDAPRIAVLPFSNLGAADDEYFADGVTEEITARLAGIPRLRVIAATSASVYKGTKKDVRDIGSELGVDYILEGSIRWQKAGPGSARVRITPQLVSARDGVHVWARIYDEPYGEIFRIQSDIAEKVVDALDVSLMASQRRSVEATPTHNLEAYEYYLRGNEYHRRAGDQRSARASIRMYERAIKLDTTFTLAWAMLSRAYNRMHTGRFDPTVDYHAKSKLALDRAVLLDSGKAEVHQSAGTYYMEGMQYDRALREFGVAQQLGATAALHPRAVLHMRQGRLREALADYAKIWQLDPRSALLAGNYAFCASFARQFTLADSLYDRAASLSPESFPHYVGRAELYLRWDGATKRTRAVLADTRAVGLSEEPTLVLMRVRADMIDGRFAEALDVVSRAPEIIQDRFHFTPRAQLKAQLYGLLQRPELARVHYDSARAFVSAALRGLPKDARVHSAMGIALAGLGRKTEAIQAGKRAVELLPMSTFATQGYEREVDLARIYAMVGERDVAVERLAYLLSIPGSLTRRLIRVDPRWHALRGHDGYEKLVSAGS